MNGKRGWKLTKSKRLAAPPSAPQGKELKNFTAGPREWYIFHNGGRDECQFNAGLGVDYFRIGLGFEFTDRKNPEPGPENVARAYACFLTLIGEARRHYKTLVVNRKLEIEWTGADDPYWQPRNENPARIDWLLDSPEYPKWVFLGGMLRPKRDASVLADPFALGRELNDVFTELKPLWWKTQSWASQRPVLSGRGADWLRRWQEIHQERTRRS